MTWRSIIAVLGSLLLVPQLFANPFGDSLVVVFTGGMRGRADGCGCSSGPQGGLDRRATLLRQSLGDAPTIALDCGGILDLDPEGGLAKSRCTISGLAREGLRAISVSSRDLFYGTKFLGEVAGKTGVKLLSLNIVHSPDTGKPFYDRWMVIDFAGKSVAVTGVSQPVQPRSGIEPGEWISLPPDSLYPLLAATHPVNADLTILLTDLDEASLRRFLDKTTLFDLAFTSSLQVYSATPFEVGKCLVQRPDNDGRSFEAVIIPASGDATNSRFIRSPITKTVPADPATSDWLRECLGKSSAKKD